jgi:thiol:disulfide interchange protein
MNKNLLIGTIILIVILGAGFIFLRPKGSVTQNETTGAPRNPEGVVNEEVSSSNYRLYNSQEYQLALEQEKVVMLYFTANWCPICREQEPTNMEALKSLENDAAIIAFRVHILDSETTKETEALAEQFDVPYQHTTVIIGRDGQVKFMSTGPLERTEIQEELLAAKD